MTNVRDFTSTEIKEINTYVQTNVPYSVLETIFPLTEHVLNKVKVFTIVYRIINSAKNYVKEPDTKTKLINMLNECKGEYRDLYKSLIRYQEGGFGSYNHYRNIILIMEDISKRTKIDNLIDAFLLFAEKQVFFSIDKIAGIESGKKGGEDVVDKILADKEKVQ